MRSFELAILYSDGGDLDYGDGENYIEYEYAISRDERSNVDQDSDGDSQDNDREPDNASANDTKSDRDDSEASVSSSSSCSDDDEEVELVSIGSDVDEVAEDDEVVDIESDDGSSDEEARTKDDIKDAGGDSTGENIAAGDDGDNSSFSDDSAEDEQDTNATTGRSASGGLERPHKEQSLNAVHNHITYQVFRPTNNYLSTTTYQPHSNYQMIESPPTSSNNLDSIPRCLCKAPALSDASTSSYGHTSAGATNFTRTSQSSFKSNTNTTHKANGTSRDVCEKEKGKTGELSADPKPVGKSKQIWKQEGGNQGNDVYELYALGVLTTRTETTHVPVVAKHSFMVYEMESAPIVSVSHMSTNTEQNSTVYEIEDTARKDTTHVHDQQHERTSIDNMPITKTAPHHKPLFSRT
ncbi:hypothetical protein G6011_04506 [Alternaria panax]|uniref:Uncharacterized protein n=1 Tax=Alternaria panax TaxID=48097 RepID=A0AAD4IGN0_9PLEO|nr:hypothetical protein G6011_04506 [Alternaria panax]